MGLEVMCFPFGKYSENTYLITDEATGFKAVIDPGYFGTDVKFSIQNNAYLKYLLLTHGHGDHFGAASQYLEEYSTVKFAIPEKEQQLIYGCGLKEKVIRLASKSGDCPAAHVLLKEGDVITLGETELRVIETPGHTAGGICFATDREIFTGDTLFRLSVGRTDLETGDWDALVSSIQNKLYTLDDDLVVYPGHGQPSTIGYEKKANPFV